MFRKLILPVIAIFGAMGIAAAILVPSASAAASSTGLAIGAVNNGDGTATFFMDNRTNATTFTLDYWIDDEPLTGTDYGTGVTGRFPGLKSGIAETTTHWGSGVAYRNNVDPAFRTEVTVDLAALPDLPNAGAASHVVHYRVILGPSQKDMIGLNAEAPSVVVTGFETPVPDPGTGSSGSAQWFSGSSSPWWTAQAAR
ncbi:hypothetical protein [Aldersonia kunmingensis]|uniref:hypothetical protein n=1 Tax=Aldersonia kunmingensis TaxID=408066 RepID=UPI00082AB74C|nr:hypothetical protein [Aldersonia kunmingensis]